MCRLNIAPRTSTYSQEFQIYLYLSVPKPSNMDMISHSHRATSRASLASLFLRNALHGDIDIRVIGIPLGYEEGRCHQMIHNSPQFVRQDQTRPDPQRLNPMLAYTAGARLTNVGRCNLRTFGMYAK